MLFALPTQIISRRLSDTPVFSNTPSATGHADLPSTSPEQANKMSAPQPNATDLPLKSSTLRKDSFRPRTTSTTSSRTLLTALNLVALTLAAFKTCPNEELRQKAQRLRLFALGAWTEETLDRQIEGAGEKVPAGEGASLTVGLSP